MAYPTFAVGDVLAANDMNAVGMWKITSQTFSAQTQVDFIGVFSSNYTNYRIVFDEWTATVSENHFLRLRDSSGVLSGVNYWTQRLESTSTTVTGINVGGGSSTTWFPVYLVQSSNAAAGASGYIDIFQPNVSGKYTRASGEFVRTDNTTNATTTQFAGIYNLTTALTGFSLVRNSTATMSGTVTVYGIQK